MKIFCIGMNKTGTTSLNHLFEREGVKVAKQQDFEKMTARFYKKGSIENILRVIDRLNPNIDIFFQDIPFAVPGLWRYLVARYPDAKYVLSVRDSAEQYYNSLVNFHKKGWGVNIFDPDEIKKLKYIENGFSYRFLVEILGCPPDEPYNKEYLTALYDKHEREVESFFTKHMPNQFIKINLSNTDFQTFNDFIGLDFKSTEFPHRNATKYVD